MSRRVWLAGLFVLSALAGFAVTSKVLAQADEVTAAIERYRASEKACGALIGSECNDETYEFCATDQFNRRACVTFGDRSFTRREVDELAAYVECIETVPGHEPDLWVASVSIGKLRDGVCEDFEPVAPRRGPTDPPPAYAKRKSRCYALTIWYYKLHDPAPPWSERDALIEKVRAEANRWCPPEQRIEE